MTRRSTPGAQQSLAPTRVVRCRRCRGTWPWRPVLLADPCAYCGSPAETVDHVDPRPERDRSPANQTAACWRCNHAKADRPLLLFLLRRVGIIPLGDSRRERRAARRARRRARKPPPRVLADGRAPRREWGSR